MKISQEIKTKRELTGLSEADVAFSAGITVDSYWDIENRDEEFYVAISCKEGVKLCRRLGLNPFELIYLCNPMLPFLFEDEQESDQKDKVHRRFVSGQC